MTKAVKEKEMFSFLSDGGGKKTFLQEKQKLGISCPGSFMGGACMPKSSNGLRLILMGAHFNLLNAPKM